MKEKSEESINIVYYNNVYYTHRSKIQIKSNKINFYLTIQPENAKLKLEGINGRLFFEKWTFSHHLTSELSKENSQ